MKKLDTFTLNAHHCFSILIWIQFAMNNLLWLPWPATNINGVLSLSPLLLMSAPFWMSKSTIWTWSMWWQQSVSFVLFNLYQNYFFYKFMLWNSFLLLLAAIFNAESPTSFVAITFAPFVMRIWVSSSFMLWAAFISAVEPTNANSYSCSKTSLGFEPTFVTPSIDICPFFNKHVNNVCDTWTRYDINATDVEFNIFCEKTILFTICGSKN